MLAAIRWDVRGVLVIIDLRTAQDDGQHILVRVEEVADEVVEHECLVVVENHVGAQRSSGSIARCDTRNAQSHAERARRADCSLSP